MLDFSNQCTVFTVFQSHLVEPWPFWVRCFCVWYSRHFRRFQDLAAFAVDDSDEEDWELVTWATQRGRCGQVGRERQRFFWRGGTGGTDNNWICKAVTALADSCIVAMPGAPVKVFYFSSHQPAEATASPCTVSSSAGHRETKSRLDLGILQSALISS
jgi:hypothetical protein